VSRDVERSAVFAHLQSVWNSAADGPLAIPNLPFNTPAKSPFADVHIVERGTYRKSLGMNFYKRFENTLQVDMYSPADSGTKRSRATADRLEDIYQDLILPLTDGETVIFGTPSSRTLALNEQRAANLDDNWDRYMFEVPYYRDQQVEK